ncbi:uroporphyrinogen-III synthase [Siccirubricoccus sp. KC 17139]|uniref:Uroporphyrinogen-III synthase n=1 Tax=Siccirubricoccus soli TaxID=2899147 RepID=A0ABT1CYN2_9PROT|nr:uroporphyrinogen-III synthase [Siccirubricoccus soli]MCO6414774.1 uroporphyrinogen-III synthase [Siccirubricoccus soli]MCP2680904.1 uroporphyrinogen-III synthase [Siccirubricoccus soli]
MREGHPAPAVLITRPEPGAAETAARLAARGWQPLEAPALVLAARPFVLPRTAQALLLTSRAAARCLPDALPRSLLVLAVGEATAAEACSHGFVNILAAEGDAAALARLAVARLSPAAGPLLLAVGAGYGRELVAALRAAGFRVLRRVAYAAHPAAALPEAAREALARGTVGAALFFSPRSAHAAIALLRQAGLGGSAAAVEALAISPRVAEAARAALAPFTWRALKVAARPDQDSLLQLLDPS